MKFIEKIEGADTIAIGGHVRPDGDCVGSCMGLFGYLADHYPEKKVCVYLEEIPEAFDYLKIDEAMSEKADKYDLFIALDCGSIDRLGEAQEIFEKAVDTVCVDHHISNTNFAKENIVKANASSTCEILCELIPGSFMIPVCLNIRILRRKRWRLRDIWWKRGSLLGRSLTKVFI